MRVCVLDFETYYSRAFSLSKMSTEEYVRSPDFEVIGLAYKFDDQEIVWLPQPEVDDFLLSQDWSNTMIVAQNTAFDGAILDWHYNVKPKAWGDTLGMSRALYPHEKQHGLKHQAEREGIGLKGTEVEDFIGYRFQDFTSAELSRYADYCCNDVWLTYRLFNMYLNRGFPLKELQLIDMTIRMFTEPVLRLDKAGLEAHLNRVQDSKRKLLEAVRDMLLEGAKPEHVQAVFSEEDGVKKMLMSNDKFAEMLRMVGVEPPTKVSQTTKKQAWAFAKTDEAFQALREHDNPLVQALVEARLGNKTTLEETRTERFIGTATRGAFPIPLRYYGAATGRWSGQDKVNLQNLPSRGKNAKSIKKCITAPPGHIVIDCDSSQIEARCLAWEAGQEDLLQAFRDKADVYSQMATKIYGRPVDRKRVEVDPETGKEYKPDQREGEVGKATILGCFGPDTLVLTDYGWKPIISVQGTDMVWDGEEWVTHRGLVPQGEKTVLTSFGLSATADHEILTERGWKAWSEVCTNPHLFQSAIRRGNLLSYAGNVSSTPQVSPTDGTLSCAAVVAGKGRLTGITSRPSVLRDAILAPKKLVHALVKCIGGMRILSLMSSIDSAYSTALRAVYRGATQLLATATPIMGGAAYMYTRRGDRIEPRSYATCLPSLDGTIPCVTSTVSITPEGMNPETYGLLPVQRTLVTSEALGHCSSRYTPLKQKMQTYDLAYAGPRNRYTVWSSEGPLLVHNCGYGMGGSKFQTYLKIMGIQMDEDECSRIISTYREAVPMIVALWERAGAALDAMIKGQTMNIDVRGVFRVEADNRITLPSGLWIQYPGLRKEFVQESGKYEYRYLSKGVPTRIYGPKVVENLTQALARCVVAEQALRVAKRYKVTMMVHDSVVAIAPEAEKDEALAYIERCMSWVPTWAEGLPLACEAGAALTYGDC